MEVLVPFFLTDDVFLAALVFFSSCFADEDEFDAAIAVFNLVTLLSPFFNFLKEEKPGTSLSKSLGALSARNCGRSLTLASTPPLPCTALSLDSEARKRVH